MNGDPVWGEALEIVSRQINEGTFHIWFQQTVGLGLVEDTYSVGVASDFAKDWIDSRFRVLIADAVSQVVGRPVGCDIVVVPSQFTGMDSEDLPYLPEERTPGVRLDATDSQLHVPASGYASISPALHRGASPQTDIERVDVRRHGHRAFVQGIGSIPGDSTPAAAGLIDKYTFDTFVIGPSNRFAHAAALAAAETPGVQYNPLFIYGGVGLGKTHLLQAIGQYVLRQAPSMRVRYVTLETFTNDFINSVRDNSMEGFKNKYRTIDVLLIDDIQFLQKKEQTQEEFFHTFNTLYDAQKQIVITSDRRPKGLASLEDRLVSRFEWGLITDIQPPDLETRVAILRKKVRSDGVRLADDDVLMLIASRVPTNIRELEGCLTRVVAFSSFTKRPIDVDLAREVLQDIPETASTRITIDLILSSVAESTGVSITEIIGEKRSRPVVESRHLVMYLARELTDASLPKIGERVGGRDHTTVLHAVDKIAKLMRTDREMYNRVQHLTTKIKSAQ